MGTKRMRVGIVAILVGAAGAVGACSHGPSDDCLRTERALQPWGKTMPGVMRTRPPEIALPAKLGDKEPDYAAAAAREAQAATEALMQPFLEKLDPARVAPVVAYLAHADCPVSGEIYSAGAGQVSRFFIGRTTGVFRPQLSAEDVRDHFDEIRDEAGYTVPGGPADEMAELFGAIMAD